MEAGRGPLLALLREERHVDHRRPRREGEELCVLPGPRVLQVHPRRHVAGHAPGRLAPHAGGRFHGGQRHLRDGLHEHPQLPAPRLAQSPRRLLGRIPAAVGPPHQRHACVEAEGRPLLALLGQHGPLGRRRQDGGRAELQQHLARLDPLEAAPRRRHARQDRRRLALSRGREVPGGPGRGRRGVSAHAVRRLAQRADAVHWRVQARAGHSRQWPAPLGAHGRRVLALLRHGRPLDYRRPGRQGPRFPVHAGRHLLQAASPGDAP
mmetsp:Transcript_95126/g.284049  ORF Transcript_95126/g.284049 Transcript_95126/m.284049 type:complete len:265 (+) Transcript_95126:250-1044(+)